MLNVSIIKVSAGAKEAKVLIKKLDNLLCEAYKDHLDENDITPFLDSWEVLTKPNVTFLGAQNEDGELIGMGAIKELDGYSELKRVYVEPEYRGQGIADKIVLELEKHSTQRVIKLESGIEQPDALKFFKRLGYAECSHYGDYEYHYASVYMEKNLKEK